PASPDDPAAESNRAAWESLQRFEQPFLCAFSDKDPITAGADRVLKQLVPGAAGQAHTVIEGGGHFLQEDCGPQLPAVVNDFIATRKPACPPAVGPPGPQRPIRPIAPGAHVSTLHGKWTGDLDRLGSSVVNACSRPAPAICALSSRSTTST